MEKQFGIGKQQYIYINKSNNIQKKGIGSSYLLNSEKTNKDSFTLENKSEIRKEFEKVKKQQGIIGKVWDGLKNLIGMKSGSKYIETIIRKAEKGEIKQEEVQEAIAKYKEGQKTCVDVVADLASGILSIGAFALAVPTGGASLAVGLGLSTFIGAGIKVSIKAGDAFTTGKEYNKKDLLYDSLTGAVNGLLAPVTNGIGNTVTKTIGGKLGIKVAQTGAEKVTEQAVKQGIKQTAKNVILNQAVDVSGGSIAKRVLALGAGMAVDGALGGASDNMVRAGLNGDNVIDAGIQGAIGGAIMAPVIGGGFRIAGKAGQTINNKIITKIVLPDGLNTKFRQGQIGDCSLLSIIDGMMNNKKLSKMFKKSITKTIGGDYNVKIGDQIVRVAKESLSDEMLSDKTGIRIFEQAYKQLTGDIDGGFAELVAKQFGLNPVHITKDLITDDLLDTLSKTSKDTVLSFGTLVDTDGVISSSGTRHYFTIKDIDIDNKMVTLTSPIDTSVKIKLSYDDVKTMGISIDGGSIEKLDLPNIERTIDDKVFKAAKTHIDDSAAKRAAEIVTSDEDLQRALIRMAKEEGIVISKKEDAIPILQRQFQGIEHKDNLFVLDINPQQNNGMPKSNNLISRWFIDANNLSAEQLITLTSRDFQPGLVQAKDICSEWGQGSPMNKKLQKLIQKLQNNPQNNPISVQQAREIINACKAMSPEEILTKYSEQELAQAISKINTTIIMPFKNNGGYAAALASQLKDAIAKTNGDMITIVIPDDCSLSGSSILCDTVKILDILFKNNDIDKKVNVVFSPMILGDQAKKVISQFSSKDFPIDEKYLMKISAIRADGKESFKDARNAFNRIRNVGNIDIRLSDESIKAVHFTETETFRQIGKENPILQQQLLYMMQGPIDGNNALFGGFGQCGVMVVTPTESFNINGVDYAGKIPTNSVGFMEVLGQECGVLNDALEKDAKGIFTKGTGQHYRRYCEWEGLNAPKSFEDRIPIYVENGIVFAKNAS